MPLETRILREDIGPRAGTIIVALAGSLDTATSPDLERRLEAALDASVKTVVLDLAKLEFISSAGLRVVLGVRKKVVALGGKCLVRDMQPQIAKVFEVVKALPGMSIFRDEKELDAYLASLQRPQD